MGFSWILKQPAACVWGDEKAGLTFQQQHKEIMPLSICFALSVAMGNLLLGKKLTNVTTWSRPDWDSRSSQSSATIFAIFIWHGSEVFKVHLPILQSDAWIRPQLSMGCEDPAWRRHLYSWNLWSSFGVLILYWQLCDVATSFILFFRGTCIYIHIHVEHMYIPSGNFT